MTRYGKWLLMLAVVSISVFGCGNGGGDGTSNLGGSSGNVVNTGTSGYTINMNGGDANTGSGGDGGDLDADIYGTKGIEVGTAGTIDTRFTYPKDPPTSLGTNPLVVDADLTIDNYATQALAQAAPPAGVADGDYYMFTTSTRIWLRDSTGGDTAVTGIDVQSGVTLTLGLNWNFGGNTGQDGAYVGIDVDPGENDIRIAGTVTTKDLTTGDVGALVIEDRHGGPALSSDKGGLHLDCDGIIVTSTGVIDTSGDDALLSNDRGGDGGFVELDVNYGGAFLHGSIDASGGDGDGTGVGGDGGRAALIWGRGIYVWSDGVTLHSGANAFDCSGGAGSTGGGGGYIDLEAYTFVYNMGTLVANGGTGTTGGGGNANYIYFYSEYASLFNSGRLEANGGNTTDGTGGDGGYVEFYAGDSGYIGQVLNSGDIVADGGTSTNGSGGSADYVYMETMGGDVRNVGAISLNGGDGAMTGGTGGDGGYFDVDMYEGYDYGWSDYTPPGDIVIGGNFSLNGGSGDSGGNAGYIDLYSGDYDYEYYNIYGLFMHGYGSIAARGGDGTGGGPGGDVTLYTEDAYIGYDDDENIPPGPIEIRAAFDLSGGDGDIGGSGGDGGDFYVETYNDNYYRADETVTLVHVGNINTSGGDGVADGGDGGYVELAGYALVDFDGSVNGTGGNGTAGDAPGGNGAYFELNSAFDVLFSGAVDLSGGSAVGTGTGGSGGYVEVYAGGQVVSRASYDTGGGDGDATDGTGGAGDYIDISSETMTTDHIGVLDASGGTADTDGTDGTIWIDWIDYSP